MFDGCLSRTVSPITNRYSFHPRICHNFLRTGFFLIVVYRIRLSKGKKSFFLFMLILLLIFFFCVLFRFFIFERILAFLGVTTALSTFIWKVSSGSNESGNSGGETSLPALESSSSSESLATFRAVIAAENKRYMLGSEI